MFIQYRIRVVLIYMRVALLKTRYQIFAAPVAPAPTRLHMCFRDDDFNVNNLPRTDRPSRTAEISPLFDRKLVYIWYTSLKLDVCEFIISFRRFSNTKSTAENTYHDRVWLILAVFVCSSTTLCMSTGVDYL